MPGTAEPESDGDMLRRLGTDAALWAEGLAQALWSAGEGDAGPIGSEPGGLLHVWLCCAIEAGRAAGYSYARRDLHADPAGSTYTQDLPVGGDDLHAGSAGRPIGLHADPAGSYLEAVSQALVPIVDALHAMNEELAAANRLTTQAAYERKTRRG